MTAAVKTAVNGIGACAPEDSNVAVTLSVCAPEQTIWLAFINQIKVAFCYIFGLLTDIQTEIATLQNQMRTPGTVNIAAEAGAGAGATASIVGNDTAGQITITTGTGAAAGDLFSLTFDTPFATAGILHLEAATAATQSPPLPTTTTSVSDSVAESGGLSDATEYIWNYVVLGGT